MFVTLTNTPRDYAWGAPGAISALLGGTPTAAPEAELWLGTHAGSPTRVSAPEGPASFGTLAKWLAAEPAAAGTESGALPFLFKVLAAGSPLSIQAHPNAEQARAGFERENAAGIALDAPNRNYRDPFPKPELIVAMEDGFEALSGFRPIAEVIADLDELVHAGVQDPVLHALRERLTRAIEAGTEGEVLAQEVSAALGGDREAERAALVAAAASISRVPLPHLAETVRLLVADYPEDSGVFVALFLNRVTLKRGESLYLDAGNMHAYLRGVGLELMTASDNVLRGGMTPKHVDIAELLAVVRFTPGPVPFLDRDQIAPGIVGYQPAGANFALYRVDPEIAGSFAVSGPAITLQIRGEAALDRGADHTDLVRGEIRYLTPSDTPVRIAGNGEIWIAAGPSGVTA
ncbi:mannose-6-phosphate isomerase, class I [Mycetocola saprophilus]|uniref:mannose-6-phosphate isomerase, class I n=1 Tax=Mycetocola saprophilus TaxID=76636 RepID=UPI0004C12E5F|nr:mannose-6-phosphate isomerase, class I [Mycetocola saprophilus]